MVEHLVVRTPWFGYARGQVIADPAQVTEILASENAVKVQRINVAAPALEPQPMTVAEAVARGVADAEAALHPTANT